MYGQFSAKGVWPASQAFCTFDSSQVETAVGAMCALWIASYIIVSTALLAGVLMLLRFDAAICPPKLWKAVTAPSYLSPSKARPSFSLGSFFMASAAALNKPSVGVGGVLISSVQACSPSALV